VTATWYTARSGKRCSFPYVQMAALAECGTHTIVATAIGTKGQGGETLSGRVVSGGAVGVGMLVMVDAGLGVSVG
jgi:hypothetical protein